ncbi:MAG: sodium:proton antiporter [Actinomycetota bacterium]|nr:sodium:proton antiporter [Actinomycetota bacterium]
MTSVLTQSVARLLLAPILVVAVAILVKGYADVGDGFSAGVIAALGILLQYMAFGREEAERQLPVRLLPACTFAGLLAALAVAFWPVLRGDALLEHLPPPGASVIELGTIELITAVLFDVAVFLLVLGALVGIVHAIARSGEEGA